jgi:hypothetical protein
MPSPCDHFKDVHLDVGAGQMLIKKPYFQGSLYHNIYLSHILRAIWE